MFLNTSHFPDIVNGSNINKCSCVTTAKPEEVVEMDAFFYIVVVIAFYSITIVFLLIKYNRNDDEDQSSKFNYSEYVNRERFQTARYKNKVALEKTKALIGTLNLSESMKIAMGTACPVIIVSEYPENGSCGNVNCRLVGPESSSTSQTSFEDCDDVIAKDVWMSVYFDAMVEHKDCEIGYTDRRQSCHTI